MKYNKIRTHSLSIEDFKDTIREKIHDEWQFRHCKATIGITEDKEFTYLRSYNTIVCFIDNETGEAFDILRTEYGYTNTSAQHISKFLHEYPHKSLFRTYIDSKGEYYQRVY